MNLPATASQLLDALAAAPTAPETGHAPAPASTWLDFSESTDEAYQAPASYTAQELAAAVDRTVKHLEARHVAELAAVREATALHPAGLPEPFRGTHITAYHAVQPWWLVGAALGVASAAAAWYQRDIAGVIGSLIIGIVMSLMVYGLTWRERADR